MLAVKQHKLLIYQDLEVEGWIPAKASVTETADVGRCNLRVMDGEFAALYSVIGRPSITTERLLRASLLRVLYTIRSQRQLVHHIDFNLLYW